MNIWLVVVAVALGTYVLRVSFITLFGRLDEVPPRVKRALALVPPAVLAALVTPELFLVDGSFPVSLDNDRVLAGVVGAAVAWYTEDILVTVVVGMGALYALALLP